MKSIRRIGVCAMLIATMASLSACDTMTTRQRNAAIGAGIGGVARAAIGGHPRSQNGAGARRRPRAVRK